MTRHYHTLDGVRGAAALAVVAMHAGAFLQPIAVPHAYLAVDLFFALSGLVIAHAYGDRLSDGLGVGRFMLMRLIRLYPLYIAGTLIGIAYFGVTTRFGARLDLPPGDVALAIGSSLLMLPSPVALESRHWLMPFDIAAWSLIFELAANLALVLLWRRLNDRRLAAIIAVSAVVLVAQTIAHGSVDVGEDAATLPLGIARTSFSFFAGIALHRMRRPVVRVSRWAWLLPAAVVALAFVGEGAGAWFDLACVILVFPAMIRIGAMIEPVTARAFTVLGLVSYAIYALHSPLLPIAANLAKIAGTAPALMAPWGGILLVVLLALLAWTADLLYDTPVRRRLGRRLRFSRRTATLAGTGAVS